MCGIAGLWGKEARNERVIRAMTAAIVHRGPDDEGFWTDPEVSVAFGHRRLSIVDLSPAGHQPMISADGRYVLTFNGEIYNYAELKARLEDESGAPEGGWRGHSDTEVFLQAIAAWGLEPALAGSVGMFALGLWDRERRTLTLVRDRFGEKPLYYGWAGNDFVFASELKAIRAHPQFDNPIDRRALQLFASRTHVPAPFSIYQRIFKLPPGCLLEVTAEGARTAQDQPPREAGSGAVRLKRYWSYRNVVADGLGDPIADEAQAVDELERALISSIRGQSMADVPVGAFLSGGIDSSTIVALCQKQSATPVRTYTIGFEDVAFNEANDAKAVARHLGTVHHEHYVSAAEARDVIPLLPSIYDEPFADSSQIPTYLVSHFARREVTVALTGDGGDELFAGYNRHSVAPRLWARLQKFPKPLRAMAGAPLSRIPSQFWKNAGALLPGHRQPHFGSKLQKAFAVAASAASFDDLYGSFMDEWSVGPLPVLGERGERERFDLNIGQAAPEAVRTMYCDAVSYLPDDILCKVDRASMAVSLETRVPFLDHRVAELAARIPLSMKVRDGRGKQVLRTLLERYVPRTLFERPKAGFAVPVGEWIKGPLREWAEDLLDPREMALDGWFDPHVVSSRWREHLKGSRDSTAALWAILMFQAWIREQKCVAAAAA